MVAVEAPEAAASAADADREVRAALEVADPVVRVALEDADREVRVALAGREDRMGRTAREDRDGAGAGIVRLHRIIADPIMAAAWAACCPCWER